MNVAEIDVFGVQKKLYMLSKLGGGGMVIWTKSKRTAAFFVRAPLRRNEGAPSK